MNRIAYYLALGVTGTAFLIGGIACADEERTITIIGQVVAESYTPPDPGSIASSDNINETYSMAVHGGNKTHAFRLEGNSNDIVLKSLDDVVIPGETYVRVSNIPVNDIGEIPIDVKVENVKLVDYADTIPHSQY